MPTLKALWINIHIIFEIALCFLHLQRILHLMSDHVMIQGQKYVSSKRASESTGYTQDYIGQLARAGAIVAKRVGGLWYVELDALTEYKNQTELYKKENPPNAQHQQGAETLVSFDGKEYISASRASHISHYNKDYVGQLARSGKISSRQVWNRWYVEKSALLEHKQTKDALLGLVQAQSVGLHGATLTATNGIQDLDNANYPFYRYYDENSELLPRIAQEGRQNKTFDDDSNDEAHTKHSIPIRVMHQVQVPDRSMIQKQSFSLAKGNKNYALLVGFVATIIIVLSFGAVTLKNSAIFSRIVPVSGTVRVPALHLSASAMGAIDTVAQALERLLSRELVYKRTP